MLRDTTVLAYGALAHNCYAVRVVDYNNDLTGQVYPLVEPYVDIKISGETYVEYAEETSDACSYSHQCCRSSCC